MSMEISSYYKNFKNDYLECLQDGKAEEVKKEQGAENKSEGIPVPKDEYISSEESGSRPSGLYRMVRDENGNQKLLYDNPEKPQSKAGAGRLQEDTEKHTVDTDQVDREIEKLKEQKKQLEQQIKAASADEEKVKELEKELSRIEGELSQKDNDTYRRQNAEVF